MLTREARQGRPLDHAILTAIAEAIGSLRYGAVEVVVHDGRVVAIEKREKVRLDKELRP